MDRSVLVPRATWAHLSLAGCVLVGACAVPDFERDESRSPEARELIGTPAAAGQRPRGVYFKVDRGAESPLHFTPRAVFAARHRIIYMNHQGGTFSPGWSDSVANSSSIVGFTANVPAWDVSDSGWQEVMDCMREIWSPFDVEITDVDPGDIDHIESLVAGRPQDVGMGSGIGGVSPFDCGIIERSVVFTFAEVYGNDYRSVCETAAQEVAHSFGLEHEYLCEDPMTYLYGCGEKAFVDTDAQCGEYSARGCDCGGSTQNSVQMLTEANGPADRIAPVVSILSPSAGAVVAPGFTVDAEAQDDRAVTQLELYVDGDRVDSLQMPPWSFATDTALAEGAHSILIRAHDGNNAADDTVDIVVATDPKDPNDPDPNDPDPNAPDPNDSDSHAPSVVIGGCSSGGDSPAPLGLVVLLSLVTIARRKRG